MCAYKNVVRVHDVVNFHTSLCTCPTRESTWTGGCGRSKVGGSRRVDRSMDLCACVRVQFLDALRHDMDVVVDCGLWLCFAVTVAVLSCGSGCALLRP